LLPPRKETRQMHLSQSVPRVGRAPPVHLILKLTIDSV
jgi:hypothetical protein